MQAIAGEKAQRTGYPWPATALHFNIFLHNYNLILFY